MRSDSQSAFESSPLASKTRAESLSVYPGGHLVAKGLDDLDRGVASEEALLVSIAATRLRSLGIATPELPDVPLPYEHRLFEAIEDRLPRGAHTEYNALIGRIVSFAQSYRN